MVGVGYSRRQMLRVAGNIAGRGGNRIWIRSGYRVDAYFPIANAGVGRENLGRPTVDIYGGNRSVVV